MKNIRRVFSRGVEMFLLEWKGVCEYGNEASFWPGEFLMSEAHGNSLCWLEGTGVLGITEEGQSCIQVL